MDQLTEMPTTTAKAPAVFVRITPEDRERFEAAALAEDRTVANWLRRLGRLAVERQRQEREAA